MDDPGEGCAFNAFAVPQDKTCPDGPGIGTALMLHLGRQLRDYYDRLLGLPIPHHVADAADPDVTRLGKPPTNS